MTPPLFVPALGRSLYPGASVALDFTRNLYRSGTPVVKGSPSLLSGWTFSRASTGYAETAAGALVAFASGAPRITDKGLLVEEARTNLCLQSQALATTPWNAQIGGTGATPTVTENYALAPDGTMTATRLQCNLGGGTTTTDQSFQKQALTGASCRGSFYIKTTDGSAKTVYMRGLSASSVAVTGSWVRYDFDAGTLAATQFGIGLRGGQTPTNSDTCDILVWGAQLEAGAFPTSYIPTTTASATRLADDVVLSGLSIRDGCTLYHEMLAPVGVSTDARSGLSVGSTSDRLYSTWAPSTFTTSESVTNVANSFGSASVSAGATVKAAIKSAAGAFASSINGAAVQTISAGTMPTLTQYDFGKNAGASIRYWNNYIRRVVVYPTAFTDAALVAATA